MTAAQPLVWQWYGFDDFDARTLYAYIKLRTDIFVVEQNCAYAELDNLDLLARHLLGRNAAGETQACLRLVPPGLKYPEPSLGRVAIAPAQRGSGAGHALIAEGLREADARYPGLAHQIGAQAHLASFYGKHGFVQVGAIYDEDGIPHIDMLRAPLAVASV
ncbi:Acetyltransferase [Andreprevotia sp. IGB-42]|uniref:GNAT family N-acetyltransferase n=1 Tax=Andreprevotia sp. IGB-42 TaxID=2497473 RepID=UPI001358A0F9|nr:GNAT family N-acetyltransferase [Andreprevotia sp. IGB-42]KAF0812315.1 Acetyltransferase [Andreprevotia sp. IGB-42]